MTNATIDDGGSAFPCEGGVDSGLHANPGMSLRDWLAGQALVGLGTWMPVPSEDHPSLHKYATLRARAEIAVKQADAMIAALEEGA